MASAPDPIFTYDDTVRVRDTAPGNLRPGSLASIVGVHSEAERYGGFIEQFPDGVVYTIEFEDGSAVDIEEALVEKGAFPSERLLQ